MSKRAQQQQEPVSTQHDADFPFVGEVLALDLANTEIVVRGKRRDLLATPEDVARWWQAARQQYPEAEDMQGAGGSMPTDDPALLDALRALRTALRHIFNALAEETPPMRADVDVLNGVLRLGYHAVEITPEGDLLPVYRTQEGGKNTLLLSIALSALRFISEGDRKRLHLCSNERCILLFYDTTRSATRRWCSLGCLERARSIQRYRQAKKASP